jgi:hypothetical protein
MERLIIEATRLTEKRKREREKGRATGPFLYRFKIQNQIQDPSLNFKLQTPNFKLKPKALEIRYYFPLSPATIHPWPSLIF